MTCHVGFEYQDRNGETAFEIFLRYTDEKERSSAVLGDILRQVINQERATILDIGSGNGEFLKLALRWIKRLDRVEFTLLEPSDDLVQRLRLTAQTFPSNPAVKVVHSTFEDFTTDCQFDVILASHLPFAKNRLPVLFGKMLELLRSDGYLIVVLRKNDDIHEFRTRFKSKLLKREYTSLVIDDAVAVFNEFAKTIPLRISMFSSESELHLPITGNRQDAISIIEFFLNKRWEEFPRNIRKAVLDYVSRKNGILHQIDGFAVVQKLALTSGNIKKEF